MLDTNDNSEFWRYLYEYNKAERKFDGLLSFIERFYRDFSVKQIYVEAIQEITYGIRERIFAMANKIFSFVETHDQFIKANIMSLLQQMNFTVQRVPHHRAFRKGKKRIVKEGIVSEINEEEL